VALTQLRAFGALTGRRYGAFTGKQYSRPVGELTQARAYGAFTGRRYGSFAAKTAASPVEPPAVHHGGGGRMPRRISVPSALHQQCLDEDELLLIVIGGALRCGLI
jgi:hypothetical protein